MEDKARVILILNIKIDKTRSEDLLIREDDEPDEIAEKFCEKFGLSANTKEILIKHIESNLDSFIEEEIQASLNSSIIDNARGQPNNHPTMHKRSISAKNYGEVLYNKGIMMKQKVKHMIQTHKQSLLEKEMLNTTFKPKIKEYCFKEKNNKAGFDRKKNLQLIDEQNVCTFKPKINKKRVESSKPQEKLDKCIELYNTAKISKLKQEEKRKKL